MDRVVQGIKSSACSCREFQNSQRVVNAHSVSYGLQLTFQENAVVIISLIYFIAPITTRFFMTASECGERGEKGWHLARRLGHNIEIQHLVKHDKLTDLKRENEEK